MRIYLSDCIAATLVAPSPRLYLLSFPPTRPLGRPLTFPRPAPLSFTTRTQTALGDDSFINDLDGLGDDSEDEEEEEEERREGTVGDGGGGKSSNGGVRVKAEDLDSLDDSEDEDEEEGRENGRKKRKMKEGGEEGMDVERGSEFEKALPKLKGKTLDVVASLSKTRRYQEHLEKVKDAISVENPPPMSVPLESDPEYQLIVSSNRLVQGKRDGGTEGWEGRRGGWTIC